MTEHTITLTNLNIRQSIAILLARIIMADAILSTVFILFYVLLTRFEEYASSIYFDPIIFFAAFCLMGFFKVLLTIYIVLQWLNEYYEITPDYIIHRRGIIFRKSEKYKLDLVREIFVHDSVVGQLFNFATITLYDIRLNKYLDLYLIHNPRRYIKVIKMLRPDIETKEDQIRLPFMREKNGESNTAS